MRKETPNLTIMIPAKSYLNIQNLDFPLSGLSNMKTVFVMKMGICQFMIVTDMVLITLMSSGIIMR